MDFYLEDESPPFVETNRTIFRGAHGDDKAFIGDCALVGLIKILENS